MKFFLFFLVSLSSPLAQADLQSVSSAPSASVSSAPSASVSSAPGKGAFNWKQLRGYYRFGECTAVNDQPLWGGSPEDSHIEISDERDWEHGGNEDYLEAVRYNDNGNPIALMWDFVMIGKGQQISYDNDGNAYGTFESWATEDGIYGILTWDRELNKGWSVMRISQDAAGNVSYRLQQMHEGDEFARDESCKLIKR